MTANGSSSSVIDSLDRLHLELLESGRLPPIPTALLNGRDLDILAPLRYLAPGELPSSEIHPPTDRAAVAAALEDANASYGHPRAGELAARLVDPKTKVVVTGQQPGLYGGPLLGLNKMIAAVRFAEALEAAGQPAMAVFWVATEDHDWAELSKASFLDRGKFSPFHLGEDTAPLMPIGMRSFGEALTEHDLGALGGLDGSALDLVRQFYRPDARFGEAFSRLLVALLGDRAPLMLDSMLPELKRLQEPWLRKLVERRHDLDQAYARAEAETESRGYPLQVKPQPGLSPLFVLHGTERRRIVWEGEDHYSLRGVEGERWPISRLLETIEENPSVVSPGVLARPAIQDALLGTTLQVMGPSELSYLSQARATYEVLELDAPHTVLRPQVMLFEERHAKHLAELDISLEELVGSPLDKLLTEKLDADFVGPIKEQILALALNLEAPIHDLDPSLDKPLRKTRDQMARALDQLAGRVAAATARKHDVWNRRFEQVRSSSYPNQHLQERELSVAYFLGRFGRGFARQILDRLELDPRTLQGLVMTL